MWMGAPEQRSTVRLPEAVVPSGVARGVDDAPALLEHPRENDLLPIVQRRIHDIVGKVLRGERMCAAGDAETLLEMAHRAHVVGVVMGEPQLADPNPSRDQPVQDSVELSDRLVPRRGGIDDDTLVPGAEHITVGVGGGGQCRRGEGHQDHAAA